MRITFALRLLHLALMIFAFMITVVGAKVALAQVRPAPLPSDVTWIREFAFPVSPTDSGRENQLNMDPRFGIFLKISFPQHQRFWRDHGRFTPVAELAQLFIGVPGSVLLEENRYVTIDGCVPHDCGDRGMVWVDTAPTPKTPAIFVATGWISGGYGDHDNLVHLWLFSSTKMNWQKMPPQFESSLTKWWSKTTEERGKSSPEKLVLVTIVQPTGELVDLSPSVFGLNHIEAAVKP